MTASVKSGAASVSGVTTFPSALMSGHGAAAWSWSRALLAFRRSGDCPEFCSALSQAISDNTHIAGLLLGDKKMPRQLPAYIGMGDKNEAVAYVHGATMAWVATPGALAWLRTCQP